MRGAAEQRADDAQRDRLLGESCFCGAIGSVDYGTMENGARVAIQRRGSPLHCLAHGYCEAHSTPVAAQMTDEDKVFIVRRCGITFSEAATGREV